MKIIVANAKKEEKIKKDFTKSSIKDNMTFEKIQEEWKKIEADFCKWCGKVVYSQKAENGDIIVCSHNCKLKLSDSNKEEKRKESKEAIKEYKKQSMRELRQALKDSGLIKVEIYVKPENVAKIKALDESNILKRKKAGRPKNNLI